MRALKTAAVLACVLASGISTANAHDWTGVYIGIGGGYGAAVQELSFSNGPEFAPPPAFAASLDGLGADGGFFTLGAGADYQIDRQFLIGAFFDYDWMSMETELGLGVSSPIDLSARASLEVEDMWSVGGRLGYLLTHDTLLFVSAGYSRANVSDLTFNVSGLGGGVVAAVGSFDGYFIGGGAELKITEALSLKAEYRYTDLDGETIRLFPGTGLAEINDFVRTELDPDIQTARLSLAYRFGLGHGAHAVPEPVADAPVGSWSQFYLSAGGGYAFANNELSFSEGPLISDFVDFNASLDGLGGQGGAFTLGAGYDHQLDSKFVLGAFIDYTWHDAETEASLSLSGLGDDTIRGRIGFDIRDELSVGARLGYLVTPNALVFGTVGYSWIDVSDTVLSASAGDESLSLTLADNGSFSGWFLGAGVEAKLTDSISLKAEYRYTNTDGDAIRLLPGVLPEINELVRTELDPDIQTIRLSLDYRFGFAREEAVVPLK